MGMSNSLRYICTVHSLTRVNQGSLIILGTFGTPNSHLLTIIKMDTAHNPYPILSMFLTHVKIELQLTCQHKAHYEDIYYKHLVMLVFWFYFSILLQYIYLPDCKHFCRSFKNSYPWCCAYKVEWIK